MTEVSLLTTQLESLQQQLHDLQGQLKSVGSTGDNSWMMISTAMVYLMTPGLALFYGGMVNKKNVMGTMLLSYLCMGIVTVQWILFGYNLSFGDSGNTGVNIGGSISMLVLNFGEIFDDYYSPSYPLLTHAMFQCAFAVITPALISGALVNRMNIRAYCVFVLLWSTCVYDPLAHWLWAKNGWLHAYGSLDFAGGCVIHISSGFSALVCAWYFRNHRVKSEPDTEANPTLTVIGAGLLWFGWMGFNAGSASSATGLASKALVNTNASAAMSLVTWFLCDYLDHGKTSVIGAVTGAVVGLVIITPGAGFVHPGYAILMGLWGTLIVYAAFILKRRYAKKVDDPLDVFVCHGIGGVVGALLTGLFASKEINSAGNDGAFFGNPILLWDQIAAVLVTIAYSMILTLIILEVLSLTIGVKVTALEMAIGMDTRVKFLAGRDHGHVNRESEVAMLGINVVATAPEDLTESEEKALLELFHLVGATEHNHVTVGSLEEALAVMSMRDKINVMRNMGFTERKAEITFSDFKSILLWKNARDSASSLKDKVEAMRDHHRRNSAVEMKPVHN